jgi:flavin reductase (DIM6/NTAB) family NADH-FMN oxidoreductase RutF
MTDLPGIKKALMEITHGLYIVTSAKEGRINGQCLDALMQVTSQPPRIAISMRKTSLTYEMIQASGLFVVNVLCRDDASCFEKVKHFGLQSGRDIDKFASIPHELSPNGIPIIPGSKAFYECRVICQMTCDLGSHQLFIADVERAGVSTGGEPLTYYEYRKSIKNK